MRGNKVIVSGFLGHRVQVLVYGLDGSFVRQWGSEGAEPGQLNQPIGVAVVRGDCLRFRKPPHASVRVGWDFCPTVGRVRFSKRL